MDGTLAFITMDNDHEHYRNKPVEPGTYLSKLTIPSNFLNTTAYILNLDGGIFGVKSIFKDVPFLKFNVIKAGGVANAFNERRNGIIAPLLSWNIENIK